MLLTGAEHLTRLVPTEFLSLCSDMAGKLVVVGLLLLLLLLGSSDAASSPAAAQATGTNVLQKLLAQKEKLKPEAREERRAHLSEDERELMTKQIVRAISGKHLLFVRFRDNYEFFFNFYICQKNKFCR